MRDGLARAAVAGLFPRLEPGESSMARLTATVGSCLFYWGKVLDVVFTKRGDLILFDKAPVGGTEVFNPLCHSTTRVGAFGDWAGIPFRGPFLP